MLYVRENQTTSTWEQISIFTCCVSVIKLFDRWSAGLYFLHAKSSSIFEFDTKRNISIIWVFSSKNRDLRLLGNGVLLLLPPSCLSVIMVSNDNALSFLHHTVYQPFLFWECTRGKCFLILGEEKNIFKKNLKGFYFLFLWPTCKLDEEEVKHKEKKKDKKKLRVWTGFTKV